MTIEDAKVFLDNLKICINEHPVVADWLVEIANRKIEPTTEGCSTVPTISKMEQVETMSCQECKHWDCLINADWNCTLKECNYEPKDEPQTEREGE